MTIVNRSYLHSCYVQDDGRGNDAVVVSEMVEHDNGIIEPNLRVFKNPKVSFWITQKAHQTHTEKKEFESLDRLDEYQVPYKDKDREIFKLFNGYYPNYLTSSQRRSIYTSPYLYGGNINVEALVAMKYKREQAKTGKVALSPITGFFDIEMSLLKSSYGKLPLMVFTCENKVFLAIKESFMYEERGNNTHHPVTVDDIEKAAHEHIDPLVESIFLEIKGLKDFKTRLPFEFNFFVGETEADMIRWIFGKMHETKVSFIGVWNIGFDIPEIIKVLEENDIPLKEIFSDPSLQNNGLSYASYREDPRKVAHFSQKWHWLTNAAHFQFIDSMALYSYIRIVNGKEASYALDDILKQYGIGGKLKIDKTKDLEGLQTEDWHRAMLSRFFTFYALYAMWDAIGLQILEWINKDLTSMMLGADSTPIKFVPNNTIKATNVLFEDWLERRWVLGTGVDVEGIKDDDLLTGGGAVLAPQDLIAKGVPLFEEFPTHHTQVYVMSSDVDFAGLYPNLLISLNISKQTKIATLVSINAPWVQKLYAPEDAIEVMCSYLISQKSSNYDLATEFFDLPNYEDMQKLFQESLNI